MKSLEDFEAFKQQIGKLPIDEQREHLLQYFSSMIAEMPLTQVPALREHLLGTFPPCSVQDLMIEVLDGNLALNEINRHEAGAQD